MKDNLRKDVQPLLDGLPVFCNDIRASMIALISRNGLLLDANRSFMDVFAAQMPSIGDFDVRQLLIGPLFDKLSEIRPETPGDILYQDAITIGKGSAASLRVVVRDYYGDLLLMAEYDVTEIKRLDERLQYLNETLSTLRTELVSLAAKLHDQQARMEDAVEHGDVS